MQRFGSVVEGTSEEKGEKGCHPSLEGWHPFEGVRNNG